MKTGPIRRLNDSGCSWMSTDAPGNDLTVLRGEWDVSMHSVAAVDSSAMQAQRTPTSPQVQAGSLSKAAIPSALQGLPGPLPYRGGLIAALF